MLHKMWSHSAIKEKQNDSLQYLRYVNIIQLPGRSNMGINFAFYEYKTLKENMVNQLLASYNGRST